MVSLESYIRRGHHALRRWALDPRIHTAARATAYLLSGFCLSAAGLANVPLPLALALVCACDRRSAFLSAIGAAIGYRVFWGDAGLQPICWVLAGLLCATALPSSAVCRRAPMLLPSLSGLIVAATGVLFQHFAGDTTPILLYLLRVALAPAVTRLLTLVFQGRNPILEWLTCFVATLALAQIVPFPYFGLGYLAAGALCTAGAFPAAALAGLALDLAQVTPVPMTAVMTCSYLVRFLPKYPKWLAVGAPCTVYLSIMALCGHADPYPLPALLLGCLLGTVLPLPAKANHRRGETGAIQVRLEMAAGVLAQTEQLLLEIPHLPVDENALVCRAAERACGGCPCRKNCKDAKRIAQLPGLILHKPLLNTEEIPIICRKSGRFLAELHRSQEQLRSIRADRERQKEYRAAMIQQYRFLSEFLQELSDQLPKRAGSGLCCYSPQVQVYGSKPESENGDRFLQFTGIGCKYYVLLCDGMGTGLGAIQEGKTAATMLRRLLGAGYPAEHALRSLNSLCALRERAGAVTIDLAELQLDSGKVTLYKWGAMPSYLIGTAGVEKLGTAGAPPGLSVTDCREQTEKLSLRREQLLLMVSDGVSQELALRCCLDSTGCSGSVLAARIISRAQSSGEDDATVITVQLLPQA